MTSNAASVLDPKFRNFSDWIEIKNAGIAPINLNGYSISDDLLNPQKWIVTINKIIKPGQYAIIWFDEENNELHTNFTLKKSNGILAVFDTEQVPIDSISYPEQLTDIAYGRNPDDSSQWQYYSYPTPGQANGNDGIMEIQQLTPPDFSRSGGFYNAEFFLELTTNEPNAVIRYTLDGSMPDSSSMIYSDPIFIKSRIGDPNIISEIPTGRLNDGHFFPGWNPPDGEVFKANVVRARTFQTGDIPSTTVTNTYFVDTEIHERYATIPVISLVTDNEHLFDEKNGIYVVGTNADTIDIIPGISNTSASDSIKIYANYDMPWERPSHIEFYETNGDLGFAMDIGARIAGYHSPRSPQKGLHIIARTKYGKDRINYRLFPDGRTDAKNLNEFKRFTIRSWGQSRKFALIQDAFSQMAYSKSGLDLQDYRPAIVFINGEYWGLHEIRENNKNSWYYQSHYGIDRDNPGYDILQFRGNFILEGDGQHWNDMMSFLSTHDLSKANNYKYLASVIDIDNFIDYVGHCVYSGKRDWPGSNEAAWRPRTIGGRWRWIQYDMDVCFSHWWGGYSANMVDQVLHGFNQYEPHTILVRLLENIEVRNKFIQWFADRINMEFKPEVLENYLDDVVAEIEPYLPEYQARWQLNYNWYSEIDAIRSFIRKRPEFIINQLSNEFNLTGMAELELGIEHSDNNVVKINTLSVTENLLSDSTESWSGNYFKEIPFTIVALPADGYEFVGWECVTTGKQAINDTISFVLLEDTKLIARFRPKEEITGVVINEFSANNQKTIFDEFNEFDDWIELYNAGDDTIDMGGIYITDDLNELTKWEIPSEDYQQTFIPPGKHLLLWADNDPDQGPLHLDFRLNNAGEQIGLIQICGIDTMVLDTITFQLQSPDLSYGRYPDGSEKWAFFTVPTPGVTNNNTRTVITPGNNYLGQNFPNPFQFTTTIQFYIADTEEVTLDIVDLLGCKIKSLINKKLAQGFYSINWDGKISEGNDAPSGIYFVTLQAGKFRKSKKLLLLK